MLYFDANKDYGVSTEDPFAIVITGSVGKTRLAKSFALQLKKMAFQIFFVANNTDLSGLANNFTDCTMFYSGGVGVNKNSFTPMFLDKTNNIKDVLLGSLTSKRDKPIFLGNNFLNSFNFISTARDKVKDKNDFAFNLFMKDAFSFMMSSSHNKVMVVDCSNSKNSIGLDNGIVNPNNEDVMSILEKFKESNTSIIITSTDDNLFTSEIKRVYENNQSVLLESHWNLTSEYKTNDEFDFVKNNQFLIESLEHGFGILNYRDKIRLLYDNDVFSESASLPLLVGIIDYKVEEIKSLMLDQGISDCDIVKEIFKI